MKKLYVQYGCGLSAPTEWTNFDVSPTLRIQKAPLIGSLLKSQLNTTFPSNVCYGDITKGLPIAENSCDGLYSSHTLEHLSLQDFRVALKNSYKILKKGGIFRCIVPDLEHISRLYIRELDNGDHQASVKFINNTLMGITERPRGVKGIMNAFLGNAHHLWMWDSKSLGEELRKAGFTQIRECSYNDSADEMFKFVENKERFENAVAFECIK